MHDRYRAVRALTVEPRLANSARLDDVPLPAANEGEVLVRGLAVGICGTDREITEGKYGKAPANSDRLILGHESLGRVEEIRGNGSSSTVGDLVVAMVRHPDPVPCASCAAGEWDMCRNGQFTEHGIVGRHGFATEYYRLSADRIVTVPSALGELGVLVEPASIVAKAWEHIDRIGGRARWNPCCVLVTGAGPIGLLGAMLGRQRGLEVHVFDRSPTGIKPELVHALGGTYHFGKLGDVNVEPDIILECTGASAVIWDVLSLTSRAGIVCLTGVSLGGHRMSVDVGQMNRDIVLENDVVFGTVNANRRHYEAAVQALSRADARWLRRLITRRIPLSEWQQALRNEKEDVKVVLELTA